MEFVTTTRGTRQLLKDHYIYSKNKTGNNGNTYWECVERRSGNGFKIKIVLDEGGNFLNQTGEHAHPPNPEHIDVKKIRSDMKRDARETNTKTNNIITVDIAGACDGVLAKIGKVDTIGRDVRRQRVLNMEYPPIPDNTIFEIADPFNAVQVNRFFTMTMAGLIV